MYKFDPYKTDAQTGKTWITRTDVIHIAGSRVGAPVEDFGKRAQFGELEDIACDGEGNFYMTDYDHHIIWKGDQDLDCTILAGNPGISGWKDGKPNDALFNSSYDVSSTPDGIVYVADTHNRVIRCIAIQ